MDSRQKIFISKSPSDEQLDYIKELLEDIDIKKHLEDSFVYVDISNDGNIEVLSFKDSIVYLASKELGLNNKMAVEYLIRLDEISQKFNEVCYWNNINNVKKYAVVLKETITLKETVREYAKEPIYSDSYVKAVVHLVKTGIEDYLYLEDVDA